MKPHVLTYRLGDGRELVLNIPAKVDQFELPHWLDKRCGATEESLKASAKRADEIMKRQRDKARRAA